MARTLAEVALTEFLPHTKSTKYTKYTKLAALLRAQLGGESPSDNIPDGTREYTMRDFVNFVSFV